MRKLKFLLRPSWIVMALLVALFVFLCFSILAPWQLGKNTSTEYRNQLISDSIDADPVPVQSLVAAGGMSADDEWRPVHAVGSYVPGSDVLVRLRSREGQPAFEVLTAFTLEGGGSVLVNRGYVRPVQGTQAPEVDPAPTGEVTLAGRVRVAEGVIAGRDPMVENGIRQIYTINPGQVSELTGVELPEMYLQLEPEQPGGLGVIALPQLDAGPYLSYGLQWLAFGIMAPLGLAYFVRAELRERRKEKADTASDAADPIGADAPTEPASTPDEVDVAGPAVEDIVLPRARLRRGTKTASAPLSASEAKLADRYGKRR